MRRMQALKKAGTALGLVLAAVLVPACRSLPVGQTPLAMEGPPDVKLGHFLEGAPGVLILARDGLHDPQPRNSILAFETALAAGVDGVSFDVRTSADGVPFVYGDEHLSKGTEQKGRLSTFTAEELDRVRLEGSKDFPSQYLTRLSRVLDRFGGEMILWLQIVGSPELAFQAASMVRDRRLEGTVVIQVGSHDLLRELQEEFPGVHFALALGDSSDALDEMDGTSAGFTLSLPSHKFSPYWARRLKGRFQGIAVVAPEADHEILEALRNGATLVRTDRPRAAMALLHRRPRKEETTGE